jgi:hypothetical protein
MGGRFDKKVVDKWGKVWYNNKCQGEKDAADEYLPL